MQMFCQKNTLLPFATVSTLAAVLGVQHFLLQQSDYDRLIGVLCSWG